jgi:hypothetical protein
MDWIDLAQDRDKWQALVNAVMKFGVSKGASEKKNYLHKFPAFLCGEFHD